MIALEGWANPKARSASASAASSTSGTSVAAANLKRYGRGPHFAIDCKMGTRYRFVRLAPPPASQAVRWLEGFVLWPMCYQLPGDLPLISLCFSDFVSLYYHICVEKSKCFEHWLAKSFCPVTCSPEFQHLKTIGSSNRQNLFLPLLATIH